MEYELDLKNRKILRQLDLDARQSFKQIGKKVKLSKEVVQYRIRQLEQKGIIRGYQTLIDVSKLGYLSCRFFIKFQKHTPEKEEKIIEYYKKNPKFWWVDTIEGTKDLGIACWVEDVYEFFEIKEDLIRNFGKLICDLEVSIYYKFFIYGRKYLDYSKKEMPDVIEMFSSKKADFDEKDLKILRLLASNARINVVEISSKTKISVTNINYRIKKMQEKGIVRGFKFILDLDKIGYYWYKIELRLEDLEIKKEMLNYFSRHPNIVYAYETISDNDLEVELEVKSHEEFRNVLKEIKTKFGEKIKSYTYFIWLKEHKFLFIP